MNERMIELANKANEDIGYTFKLEDANKIHELMEKFAELIVRECASVAGKYIHENKYTENGVSDFWLNETIKEHFGVEE